MKFIQPAEAWSMIQSNQIKALRKAHVTRHFRWAEVLVWRTDSAIKKYCTETILYAAWRMAQQMERVRFTLGNRPITVTSWWRDPVSNRRAGGVVNSRHLLGDGVDFTVAGLTNRQVQQQLDPWWPGGLGYGDTFTHLDNRTSSFRFDY